MVMAQGFTQEQVQSIIEDIDGSSLIDEKTKKYTKICFASDQSQQQKLKLLQQPDKALQV